MIFEDMRLMILDIQNHVEQTGDEILGSSNSETRTIGFKSGERIWEISVPNFKRCQSSINNSEFFKALASIEGRSYIAKKLSEGTLEVQ